MSDQRQRQQARLQYLREREGDTEIPASSPEVIANAEAFLSWLDDECLEHFTICPSEDGFIGFEAHASTRFHADVHADRIEISTWGNGDDDVSLIIPMKGALGGDA